MLTRRGLVKGAAASGALLSAPALIRVAPVLAGTDVKLEDCTPVAAGQLPVAVAVTPNGKLLLVTDSASTTVTAVTTRKLRRGASIDVGGAPIDVAIVPSGRTSLVLTASHHRPGLAFVDVARRKLIKRIDVGEQPHAVAIARDGKRAYVSGGAEAGTLTPVNLWTRSAGRPIFVGPYPRGVAVAPNGKFALVALNGGERVAIVDLERRKKTKEIDTVAYPHRVAISPDGKRALVTHSGLRARKVTLIDLTKRKVRRRIPVGADPEAVAFVAGGSAALVSNYGGNSVTLINLARGRGKTTRVGNRPRGLAVAPKRNRAYVINEFDGTATALKLPKAPRARRRRSDA